MLVVRAVSRFASFRLVAGALLALAVSLGFVVATGAQVDGSEPTPLTGSFHAVPGSHDGSVFTFELRLSENVEGLSYRTVRDSVVSAEGARVTGARRLYRDSIERNKRWEITVVPDGGGDVSLSVAATLSCDDTGAVCASGGRKLVAVAAVVVPGPASPTTSTTTARQASTPLTGSFHVVPGSHDGSVFAFELRFSENVEGLSYRTVRDSVVSAEGARVTGARRLYRDSVERNKRWEITVVPDGDRDVSLSVAATLSCDDAGAVCASGGRKLVAVAAVVVPGPASPTTSTTTPGNSAKADPGPDTAQRNSQETPTPRSTLTDYDADDDGLIEVDSLMKLDAVRYDRNGDGVPGDAAKYGAAFPNAATGMGCPTTGCVGYELTTNLDFDTDSDGSFDSDDDYWNGGNGWTPLPWIELTLEGNNNTISNLYVKNSQYGGILGLIRESAEDSVIRNIGLLSVTLTGQGNSQEAGALTGWNYGTITNSHVTGSVTMKTATFYARSYAGGLVGRNHGTITGSYSTANVTGILAGGLAGSNNGLGANVGVISGSHATGNINGTFAGGLVGADYTGTITTSYATGNVTGQYAGGLVGYTKLRSVVSKSYATGNVTSLALGSYVGGLVGFNNSECTISDSYATGNATAGHGITKAGGLAGVNYGGTITNSYATGSVTNSIATSGRGLVGNDRYNKDRSTVTDSYWDTETSGQAHDTGLRASRFGNGKTTTELKSPTSNTGIYSNWDSETWNFGTASQYPTLKGVGGQ